MNLKNRGHHRDTETEKDSFFTTEDTEITEFPLLFCCFVVLLFCYICSVRSVFSVVRTFCSVPLFSVVTKAHSELRENVLEIVEACSAGDPLRREHCTLSKGAARLGFVR